MKSVTGDVSGRGRSTGRTSRPPYSPNKGDSANKSDGLYETGICDGTGHKGSKFTDEFTVEVDRVDFLEGRYWYTSRR